ncbi:hypothetical protein ACP275_08G043800 [Erythranthe tilingii]
MASSSRRREFVPPPPPRFAKVIVDPKSDILRIPASFRRRYGQTLPGRVLLKVPNGSGLEVELVQSDGETLIQKGWREFKERFSIGFGYFLMFEYNGESQFDVVIFDTTASEIEYPPLDDDDDCDETIEPRRKSVRRMLDT